MPAAIRLRDSDGVSYNDPSPDVITYVVLGLDDDNRFVVLERLDAEHTYAQAYRNGEGDWTVEYRAGGSDSHFEATASDPHAVVRFLTDWSYDRPAWRDAFAWAPMVF